MPTEIRYTRPYLSEILWVLNPIQQQVMDQNSAGQQVPRLERLDPGLKATITPYLGSIALKASDHTFPAVGESGPLMGDVMTAAGSDVEAAWAAALDTMSDAFEVLKDQPAEEQAIGLKTYMRLDAWLASFPFAGGKRVVAVLGVYNSDSFEEVLTYIPLQFNDGSALRQREQRRQSLVDQIAMADSILADPPTMAGWAERSAEDQAAMTAQAPEQKAQAQAQLDQMNTEYVAPLRDLIAIESVVQSLGLLATGIFATLKSSEDAWADVDVAALMNHFTIPSVD